MKVIIEDYHGNDLCSFEAFEIKNFKNCSLADIDEDEEGIRYIRLQLNNL
tara:strand:- start:210 stop:359 length:150 start_codon:yes stop_codon:yes gene_type:complete